MTNRILRLFLFILPVFLLVLPACYTLLKHPKMRSMGYTNTEIKQCNDCHDAEELWYYHEPRSVYIPGNYHDPWFDYYSVPWWYESYWLYQEPGGTETRPLPRRGLRPGGSQDPTAPGSGGSINSGGSSNVKSDTKINSKKKKSNPPPEKDKKRSFRPKKKKGDKEKDDG